MVEHFAQDLGMWIQKYIKNSFLTIFSVSWTQSNFSQINVFSNSTSYRWNVTSKIFFANVQMLSSSWFWSKTIKVQEVSFRYQRYTLSKRDTITVSLILFWICPPSTNIVTSQVVVVVLLLQMVTKTKSFPEKLESFRKILWASFQVVLTT